ncbi:hypothetical protein [Tistrella mobilis]|uniref:His-Xaa-Ser system protein HxsD n=1 Tax=Tistrella mobilis (strain KA081020-065) TaxID=1110502 RepID=I3TK20_TISMK|nr:hypothetical protein [Tistrella mobilis]AFK53108.1 hypothetical protein TMO_1269 [Tistrella mobilis KA081020-065]
MPSPASKIATTVEPEQLLRLDIAYPAEAVLHTAYEMAADALIWLVPDAPEDTRLVAFARRLPDGVPVDAALIARFLERLTDQSLRVMLRDRTAGMRDAVFRTAMAALIPG